MTSDIVTYCDYGRIPFLYLSFNPKAVYCTCNQKKITAESYNIWQTANVTVFIIKIFYILPFETLG